MNTQLITYERFVQATGFEPDNDDLERCNCPKAGQEGHHNCGWNTTENLPCFMAGPNKDNGLLELLEHVVRYVELPVSLEDRIRAAIGWPSLEEAEWLL